MRFQDRDRVAKRRVVRIRVGGDGFLFSAELDDHGFAGFSAAPNRDGLIALQDHVIAKWTGELKRAKCQRVSCKESEAQLKMGASAASEVHETMG